MEARTRSLTSRSSRDWQRSLALNTTSSRVSGRDGSKAELKEFVTFSGGARRWDRNFGNTREKNLRTADAREKFFKQCRDAGVKGVKLDFFDH